MSSKMYYCPLCHEACNKMDEYVQQEIRHTHDTEIVINLYETISQKHIKSVCISCNGELVKPAAYYLVNVLEFDGVNFVKYEDIKRIETDG